MTYRRTTVVTVAALIAAAAALTWVIASPARPHAAAPAAPALAAAPTGSTGPTAVVPSSPAAPSSTLSASGGPTAPVTRVAAATRTADAQPFVQSFADMPGVPPLKALPSPKQTISVAANIDGCDHAYGLPTQCIPWTFPAGTTDKCAWLAAHGYTKLPVVAADRQKLDPDGDKIACDN